MNSHSGGEHRQTEQRQSTKVRVLVIDDHPIMLQGLADLLRSYPGFELIAYAATGREGITEARIHHPDVVVTDLRLPDITGIDVCRCMETISPRPHVIILTAFGDDEAILGAVLAGVSGFLLKSTAEADLMQAIEGVRRGVSYVHPYVANRLLAFVQRAARAAVKGEPLHLTEREALVLSQVETPRSKDEGIGGALRYTEYCAPRHNGPRSDPE